MENESNQKQMVRKEDTEAKSTIRNKAIFSLMKTLWYVATGRLHFARSRIGKLITMEDGQEYTVFRQVIVDSKRRQSAKPGAILIVSFDFAHGSPKQNKLLSLIPIPFIAGLPGFRSKTWALQQDSGGFQGIYEFDTIQNAETYQKSFAIKLMAKRAIPGSITFQIIPQQANKKGDNEK
ncbi:hypothetical protein ACFLVG_03770 [Chloroflexota bacterium]